MLVFIFLLSLFFTSISFVYAQNTVANSPNINQLLTQLQFLQAELAKLTGSTPACTFSRTLYVGTQGTDVTCLQTYLKKKGYFTGTATGFYGPLTKDAVYKWQLSAGIVPEPKAIGMFGPRSQERLMAESRSIATTITDNDYDDEEVTPYTDTSDTDDVSSDKKPTIIRTEPAGTLSDTEVVTLRVTTDIPATCKYDTESGVYRTFDNSFNERNSLRHSVDITHIIKEVKQRFYVQCISDAGKVSSEKRILFTVKSEDMPDQSVPETTPSPSQNFSDGTPRSGNEIQCSNAGWHKITTTIDGRERQLMYKGPVGVWKGSIVVMHGGGGDYTQWCYTSAPAIKPQVDFSDLAVSRGFGVFLLDSTNDVVTDANGRLCGKRFDATVVDGRTTNVDLPYIERVIKEIIPSKRPSGSSPSIFMTGESTGGYMTTRASTHFDNLITAFAPAASGDPYGTYFDCNPALSPRDSAKGAGFDRETNLEIIMPNSCVSASYQNEKPWETMSPSKKPAFKTFHSADDGVADLSCREKVATQLSAHGYPDDGAFVIPSTGTRSVWAHFWQRAYNEPVVDFFLRYRD